jgi:hypothetical protein
LMSCGANIADAFRQLGVYAGRIPALMAEPIATLPTRRAHMVVACARPVHVH